MSIDEFMEQYGEIEGEKVRQMIENGTFNIDDFIAVDPSPNSKRFKSLKVNL